MRGQQRTGNDLKLLEVVLPHKMSNMNILYLIFGDRLSNHVQARLSMVTFVRQMRQQDRIYVITTKPQFYEGIKFVTPLPISDGNIKEWEGSLQFFWRVKIKAMQYLCEICPGSDLLYLDSDTYLQGDYAALCGILERGQGVMHINEGHPKDMKFGALRMWRKVRGHTYGGVTIGAEHCMWNAGVVGLPGAKAAEALRLALTVCDGMLADGADRRLIEQYALSIALFETVGLTSAESLVGHYWSNKDEWNNFALSFFVKEHMLGRSFDDECRDLDIEELHRIPLNIHLSNTQRRLTNVLKHIFKDKIQDR